VTRWQKVGADTAGSRTTEVLIFDKTD